MTKYSDIHNPNGLNTPQTQQIEGRDQIKNDAGGFVFKITPWEHVDRFLILGSENGTYYTKAESLTKENSKNLLSCIKEDGSRVVEKILEISKSGRAPKNAPAIYALALVASMGETDAKKKSVQIFARNC